MVLGILHSLSVKLCVPYSKSFCHQIISQVFFIFAGFIGLSMLYVRIFVPETKGKTIEEVQEFFSKDGNWDLLIYWTHNYVCPKMWLILRHNYADWLSVIDRNIGKWIKRSHKKDFSAIDSFKQIFDSTDDKPDDKSNDSIQRSNEWKKSITMFGVANMTQWVILYDSKNRFRKRVFFSALRVFFNFKVDSKSILN